jgi:hypothetical protein
VRIGWDTWRSTLSLSLSLSLLSRYLALDWLAVLVLEELDVVCYSDLDAVVTERVLGKRRVEVVIAVRPSRRLVHTQRCNITT